MSPKSQMTCATVFVSYFVAMLLAPVTSYAGCTEYSASDVERAISRPQNVEELLRNLNLALDRDFLLAPEFYSDSNLMTLFNGTSVQWHSMAPPEMQGAAITPNPSLMGIEKIGVRTWKMREPPLDNDIRVQVAATSGVTLGAVRRVFGAETSTTPPASPTHPMAANAYMPPTYPAIAYVKLTPSAGAGCHAARVEARFSADVDLRGLHLGSRNPTPLPDQAIVTSISIEVRKE